MLLDFFIPLASLNQCVSQHARAVRFLQQQLTCLMELDEVEQGAKAVTAQEKILIHKSGIVVRSEPRTRPC
jgi:hypothetical protein